MEVTRLKRHQDYLSFKNGYQIIRNNTTKVIGLVVWLFPEAGISSEFTHSDSPGDTISDTTKSKEKKTESVRRNWIYNDEYWRSSYHPLYSQSIKPDRLNPCKQNPELTAFHSQDLLYYCCLKGHSICACITSPLVMVITQSHSRNKLVLQSRIHAMKR